MKNALLITQSVGIFLSLNTLANTNDNLYYFDKLQIQSAWEITRGTPDISVALISTGLNAQYFDEKNLKKNAGESGNGFENDGVDNDNNGYVDDVLGVNTLLGTADPTDIQGLGTYSASLIASQGFGIAPRVAIVPIAVLDGQGSGTIKSVMKGISYAQSRQVNLISMTLGAVGTKEHYAEACEQLKNIGIPVIVPAGNSAEDLSTENESNVDFHYPVDCNAQNVFVVASTDQNDNLSYFSNFGATKVHVAAPGNNILGLGVNGTPKTLTGTSIATALATGVAALVLSLHPEYSPAQLFQALMESVDHTEELTAGTISGGRLNAYQALLTGAK